MSAAELDLLHAEPARADADAWLVSGAAPAEWLAALAELGLAGRAVQVFPLPRSARDPRATGALLVDPGAPSGAARCTRAQPMRRIGSALYVPAEAELVPPALERELDALLAGRIGVLLPGKRFVAFAASDALAPLDLLAPPRRRETSWDGAVAGLVAAPALVAIDVESPPVAEALRSGGEEIGAQPLAELPPAPGEPPRAREWPAKLRGALSRGILRWTAGVPRTAGVPTWIDALERFAGKLVSSDVLDERARQLARLLALLESDPDKALRYALPVQGPGGRGVAAPGSRLQHRTPDYDPARLARAGAIDAWDVDPRVSWQLLAHYRRLANRELELGRARRAAYVFAELLGDLRAAAAALESGQCYLEAAQLHRERLGDRHAAARCLERGGLLVEALAEWRALGKLEHVAELLTRLGRLEEARAVHRERVELRLAARDRLGAATILERDLRRADEALVLLAGAWPDDPNFEPCLRSYFGLLARAGRHAEALRFVSEHGARPPASGVRAPWLRVLAHLAASPGESELRAAAADSARVLVGRALLEASGDRRDLLDALARSAPQDPLLRRDALRFAHERRPAPREPALPRRPRLEATGEFRVDVGVPELCSLASTAEHLFVFTGERETQRPRLEAYSWRTGRSVATWAWPYEPALLARGLCEIVPGETWTRILVVPVGSQRRFELVERVLASGGLMAGTPDWLPTRVRAVCPGERDELWVAHQDEDDELVLGRYGPAGELLGTLALSPLTEADLDPTAFLVAWQPSAPVSMAVVGTSVFVAASPLIWRVDAHWRVQRMSWTCERVLAPPPLTRDWPVMQSERGCVLLDLARGAVVELCKGATLCCAFLRGGLFVVVHVGEITIARLGAVEAREVLVEPRRDGGKPPVGLVPAELPDEFALVGADGRVQRLRVLGA